MEEFVYKSVNKIKIKGHWLLSFSNFYRLTSKVFQSCSCYSNVNMLHIYLFIVIPNIYVLIVVWFKITSRCKLVPQTCPP